MAVSGPGCDAAELAEDEFLALVYGDEQLVQLEFDAIVSAEWDSPPPDECDDEAPRPRPRDRVWTRHDLARMPMRPRRPGIGGWARQRSPPHTTDPIDDPERQVIDPACIDPTR